VVVRGGGFLEIALVDLRGLDEHVPMCTFFFEKVSASPLSTWVPRPKSPGAVFHCCYIWLGLGGALFLPVAAIFTLSTLLLSCAH
jgi:hypothetical protein